MLGAARTRYLQGDMLAVLVMLAVLAVLAVLGVLATTHESVRLIADRMRVGQRQV
jgi:hypothetical protein